MASARVPNILLIDDQPESNVLLFGERATTWALHPHAVEIEDILKADLILVDYGLDDWQEREQLEQVCLKPPDGLALAALLRRHAHKHANASPVAFALYTQRIDAVAWPAPLERRSHALAAMTNLEWVFQKGQPGDRDTLNQIATLAEAVTQLPSHWPSSETGEGLASEELCRLLAVKGPEELKAQLRQEVEDCLPPIHELSQWSHGLAVLRWLLQRILPFPCFLLSLPYLAARLRVAAHVLEQALGEGKPLRAALAEAEYEGVLRNFDGPRWWRSRVDLWLWERLGAQSADDDAVYATICAAAGEELTRSAPSYRPLVCLNTLYEPLPEYAAIGDAVRIRPDGWPAFAEQAWARLAHAKDEPRLRALVLQEDRELLTR